MHILLFIVLFSLLVALAAYLFQWHMPVFSHSEATITKNNYPSIVGNLKRQFDNDQAFVIDPVDQKKIWLNSNDDMYEDANDKVWRLY